MRQMPLKEDGYYSLPRRRERVMPHRAPSGSASFNQETEAVRGEQEASMFIVSCGKGKAQKTAPSWLV